MNPNAEAPAGTISSAVDSVMSVDNNSKPSTTSACTAREQANSPISPQMATRESRKIDQLYRLYTIHSFIDIPIE